MKNRELIKWGILWAFVLLLIFGSFSLAQQKLTPSQQLQQAKVLIAKQNIIIADIKLDRNNAIAEVARLAGLLQEQRNGIIGSERILQEAINNDTKIDYEALIGYGWDLLIPNKPGKKSKGQLPL